MVLCHGASTSWRQTVRPFFISYWVDVRPHPTPEDKYLLCHAITLSLSGPASTLDQTQLPVSSPQLLRLIFRVFLCLCYFYWILTLWNPRFFSVWPGDSCYGWSSWTWCFKNIPVFPLIFNYFPNFQIFNKPEILGRNVSKKLVREFVLHVETSTVTFCAFFKKKTQPNNQWVLQPLWAALQICAVFRQLHWELAQVWAPRRTVQSDDHWGSREGKSSFCVSAWTPNMQ